MRLTLAFDAGLDRPDRAVCFHPMPGFDLAGVRADVVQPLFAAHAHWQRTGVPVTPDRPEGRWNMAVVCATRSKAQTRDLIAQAATCADMVVVDGQKTDGIDSLYKELRKRTDVLGTVTKAHGRIFWFAACDLSDWIAAPQIVDGFQTRAGVFSADGIDPASAALIDHLPATLKGSVLDLGAGWGALSKAALGKDPSVATLIEADYTALSCAKENITDPRAMFHWADATKYKGQHDWVIMNPPFHTGRKGEPSLGQAFIEAAARSLKPRGTLWMVANAHLPYEATLDAKFASVIRHTPNRSFKIFEAARPKR